MSDLPRATAMTWTPIPIPPDRDAWATPYGFMIDHIWAQPEVNVARLPHWPEDMHIGVYPCYDLDPPGPLNEGATHWVFFEDGTEYGASAEDMAATDWMVGTLSN